MLLVKNRYMREIKNQREIDPDFSLALSIIDYLENKKNSWLYKEIIRNYNISFLVM